MDMLRQRENLTAEVWRFLLGCELYTGNARAVLEEYLLPIMTDFIFLNFCFNATKIYQTIRRLILIIRFARVEADWGWQYSL